MQRVRTSASNGHMEAGNADYVGCSTAVYRRIASEAKDCYQALLYLRNQFIQKSLLRIEQDKLNQDHAKSSNEANLLGKFTNNK